MKTLSSLQQPFLHITESAPWKHKTPKFFHPKSIRIVDHFSKNWILHAEAKSSRNRSKNKENVTKKSYKNNREDDEDDDEKIPDVVWERMISRILTAVGVPLVIGVAFLKAFEVVKEQHLFDVPIWLPFLTTFITFGASALGIAYGTLTTSWDPDRNGSVLGFEEAQKNWVDMWREDEESR